jgi:hypothetical protein
MQQGTGRDRLHAGRKRLVVYHASLHKPRQAIRTVPAALGASGASAQRVGAVQSHAAMLQGRARGDQQSESCTADLRINLRLDTWISNKPELQQERLVWWIFHTLAVLAPALVAVGLHGIVSFTVAQRIQRVRHSHGP